MWWSSVRIWPSRPFSILGIYPIKSSQVLYLFIPQLFQPLEIWSKDFQFEPIAPNLSKLLRNHEIYLPYLQPKNTGLDASLFKSIGLTSEHELPIAYYQLQAEKKTYKNRRGGQDKKILDEKVIVCADPVHLEVGLNDITLTQVVDDLSDEEVKQCIAALNAHFKQDGFEFIYSSNHQWYLILNNSLESENEINIRTVPLTEVLRKNIAYYLPVSKKLNWKKIQNEAQMILHSMPLNQQREMQGKATVNSLWFYGAGKPQDFRHDFDTVWGGDNKKGEMIASTTNYQFKVLPRNASEILNSRSNNEKKGSSQIILDQLMIPAIYDDIDEYQQQLTQLDDYIKPIIHAWENKEIDLIIDSCNGIPIKPIKSPIWKIWANKLPTLTALAAKLNNT